MIWTFLQLNPLLALAWVAAIVLALTVHEFSHALVAKMLGDNTAEEFGRLSLNPLVHLDWMGFLAVLLLGFGWAAPVPYDPAKLKHPNRDAVLIALAGPGINLLFALVSLLLLRGFFGAALLTGTNLLVLFLLFLALINLFLFVFNLVPLFPLDGSKLLPPLFERLGLRHAEPWILMRSQQILLVLIILSLLTPVPVFSFVSTAAFGMCDAVLGQSCVQMLNAIAL